MKKRAKRCILCGRSIRSGYKYCYEHRYTKTEDYGLPPEKVRRKYYAQPAIASLIMGFSFILISLFTFKFSLKYGFILLILGIVLLWTGFGASENIEKRVIGDKIRAKNRRKNLYEEMGGEHSNLNEHKRFEDRLNESLGNLFRALGTG